MTSSQEHETAPSTADGASSSHEFLRLLGHEIRNHLAPLQNVMHVLRLRGRTDPMLAPVLDMLDRQLKGMLHTLESVAEAERASRGEVPLQREPMALDACVHEAVERAMPAARTRGQRLDVAPLPALVIGGDPAKLGVALDRVLDNAVRHGPEGSRIAVDVVEAAGSAVIAISDEGPGLPPALVGHAFEFMAARERNGAGVGLGLPLAQRIVAAHGGAVDIDAGPGGRGTRVRLRLPLEVRTGAAAPGPSRVAEASHPPATRKRVLIADDSAAVRASLADLLHDMGHDVEVAADGLEAVERAQGWRPDVVLADIHMPKLNGFDVARRLRAQFPRGTMQLVMLSGNDLDEVMVRGAQQAGFDHWIDKGRAIEELDALLGSVAPPAA